jgi:hypothetical protein
VCLALVLHKNVAAGHRELGQVRHLVAQTFQPVVLTFEFGRVEGAVLARHHNGGDAGVGRDEQ